MNPSPLPLANRYVRFRDEVFGRSVTETALPGIEVTYSELDWQSLWFAGAFGADFTTTDDQKVKITDFGTWNSGPGPDFTGGVADAIRRRVAVQEYGRAGVVGTRVCPKAKDFTE